VPPGRAGEAAEEPNARELLQHAHPPHGEEVDWDRIGDRAFVAPELKQRLHQAHDRRPLHARRPHRPEVTQVVLHMQQRIAVGVEQFEVAGGREASVAA